MRSLRTVTALARHDPVSGLRQFGHNLLVAIRAGRGAAIRRRRRRQFVQEVRPIPAVSSKGGRHQKMPRREIRRDDGHGQQHQARNLRRHLGSQHRVVSSARAQPKSDLMARFGIEKCRTRANEPAPNSNQRDHRTLSTIRRVFEVAMAMEACAVSRIRLSDFTSKLGCGRAAAGQAKPKMAASRC